jgi:hypothetical protein
MRQSKMWQAARSMPKGKERSNLQSNCVTQRNPSVSKLHLNLNAEYFDQINSGEKPDEYRLCTPYWVKRLEGRTYDGNKHFGQNEVTVFAIKVN